MDNITKQIPINSINVIARIRKDAGAIDELADDIRERGLINPVTIVDAGDGKYQLIAGLRRMEACKQLGYTSIWASVLSLMAADKALRMEYAENVQRVDFTNAEKLEYAEKIKEVEKAKAWARQMVHARDGHTKLSQEGQVLDNCPEPIKGNARDFIAKRVGFTSGRQYERAQAVAKNRPELLERIDNGELTISGAYKQTIGKDKPGSIHPIDGAPIIEKPKSADQVARAGHDRLMRNPLYTKLQEELIEAKYDANRARAELDRKAAFFANQVKHFTSNIDALKFQVLSLQTANAALLEKVEQLCGKEALV